MPRTWDSGLVTHLAGELTTLAFGFDIIPRDGGSFHFTDHDDDILVGSNLYLSRVGFERTALSSRDDFSADNTEVRGIFDDEGLKESDLLAGRFDFAEVRIFLFNWANATQSGKVLRGRLGRVRHLPSGVFETELRGLTEHLLQRIGRITASECDTDLGDPVRCKIPINPEVVVRGKTYLVGDFVRARTAQTPTIISIPLTNAGGESLTGWTTVSGNPAATMYAGFAATQGTFYFTGTGSSPDGFHISQFKDLTPIVGFSTSDVDAGKVTIAATHDQGNAQDSEDGGRVAIDAISEDGRVLRRVWNSGFKAIEPTEVFQRQGIAGALLPVGTRGLLVHVEGITVSGTACTVSIDNLILNLEVFGAAYDYSVHENFIYKCVTPGVTASTEPSYDPTLDNITDDGTAQFQALDAWTRDAEVSAIINAVTVEITVDEPRAVNGWFAAGVITPETGENAGISQEIKDWNGTTMRVSLYDRFPFNLTIGTRLKLSPGCMKRLRLDCRDKFSNAINFQGIPDASGSDAVTKFRIP